MKTTISTTVVHLCGAGLLIASASLAEAQQPSSPAQGAPPPAAAPNGSEPAAEVSTDQASYLFGLAFGEQLHSLGVVTPLSTEEVTRGIREGLQGKTSTPPQQQQVQEYVHTAMAAAVKRNQTAAADFLARNAHEKGVITTATGLQYKVIAAGDRKAPAIAPSDEVTVQYRGKLLDGSVFDSSDAHGGAATFKVNRVINGWQEALVMMKPGSKWQVFVPPALGYDLQAKPGIPAGSLLIFDVDVVSVKPVGAPVATPAH